MASSLRLANTRLALRGTARGNANDRPPLTHQRISLSVPLVRPISVDNAEGYFQKNEYNAYSLNNITAKKSADGSVAVHAATAKSRTVCRS